MVVIPSVDGVKNATISLSPGGKVSVDEYTATANLDLNTSTNVDQTTEKGNTDEGFCCVMSMHDGVVL